MNDSLSYARKEKKGIYNALDGSVYTNFLKNKRENNEREVNSKFILSFNLNTDGAPIVKSRGYSMWPLIGTIVELGQTSREKFENIVTFGMLFVLHDKYYLLEILCFI